MEFQFGLIGMEKRFRQIAPQKIGTQSGLALNMKLFYLYSKKSSKVGADIGCK